MLIGQCWCVHVIKDMTDDVSMSEVDMDVDAPAHPARLTDKIKAKNKPKAKEVNDMQALLQQVKEELDQEEAKKSKSKTKNKPSTASAVPTAAPAAAPAAAATHTVTTSSAHESMYD